MFLPIFKMQIKCICGDSADDTGRKTCTSTLKSSHLKSAVVLKALTHLAMSSNNNNRKSETFRLTQHFLTQVLRQKPERSCSGRRPEIHPLGTNIFSQERGGFGSTPFPQPWDSEDEESIQACQVRLTNLLKHHWRQMPTQKLGEEDLNPDQQGEEM